MFQVIETLKDVVDLGARPLGSQANLQAVNIIRQFSWNQSNKCIFEIIFEIWRGRLNNLSALVDNQTLKAEVDHQVWMISTSMMINEYDNVYGESFCNKCDHILSYQPFPSLSFRLSVELSTKWITTLRLTIYQLTNWHWNLHRNLKLTSYILKVGLAGWKNPQKIQQKDCLRMRKPTTQPLS